MRAVEAVRGGMSQSDAARIFGVSRRAVNGWVKKYQRGGAKALKAKRRGRPSTTRLKPHQAALVARTVQDRCPDQVKMPHALWTRGAVQEFIQRKFDITVSVWTAGRYLKRWGFTPQKPLKRAYEQDPQAVQHWLETEYPAIRKRAGAESAEIHWGDEMGVRTDHHAGRTYGRRGQTPVVPGTGKRVGCNMISSLTNRGHLAFMVFHGKFNTEVFIEFLRRLTRTSERKVFLIVDRHSVHRSAKVTRWVAKHHQDIELFFLPSYSPELNPDELLNHDVKANAVGRQRPRTREDLKYRVRSFLWSLQKTPERVRRYFHAPQVRYAMDESG